MNKIFKGLLLFSAALSVMSCSEGTALTEQSNLPAEAKKENSSRNFYFLYGTLIAEDLKNRGFSLSESEMEQLLKGLKASAAQSPEARKEAQEIVQSELDRVQKETFQKNTEAGRKFLKENAAKKSVKTTASGLQYEVLKDAAGAKPTMQDKVKVHYQGSFTDGKVFDSSVERAEPLNMPLAALIKGWQEGLQLMSVGSKYRFVLPPSLAYGEKTAGSVPPNAVLVFEIELLGINE